VNSTRSQLKTIIDLIRITMDEPETNSKYTDAVLATSILPVSMSAALTMLNADQDNPIVSTWSFDIVAGQRSYVVPGRIGMVRSLAQRDTSGYVLREIPARNWSHPAGYGWRIEGGYLQFNYDPQNTGTWVLEYEPGELACPHYSTGGDLNAALDTLTLDLSPDLGQCDFAENAYVGQELTIINTASNTTQTRTVSSQASTSGTITVSVDRPFTAPIATGTVTYELMPSHVVGLNAMIAYHACMLIGVSRSISEKKWTMLMQSYKSAKKSAIDKASNLMGGAAPSTLGRTTRKGGYDATRGGIRPNWPH
jgi:hypothetical protein